MLSTLFLIASLLAVEAKLTDGQQFRGELQDITNDRVTLTIDGDERSFDALAIDKLVFDQEPSDSTRPAAIVELTDGSMLGVQGIRFATSDSGQRDKVSAEITNLDGRKSTCPANAIRSIRYSVNDDQLLAQWQEIRQKSNEDNSSDLLVIRRSGNLDYLAGAIEGFSAEEIKFEYSGNSLDVPISKAAGLIFAQQPTNNPAAQFVVATSSGSVWYARKLGWLGNSLELTSVSGARHQLATAKIKSIEFVRDGVVYASDLDGQDIKYEPFLQSNVIGPSLLALGEPCLDQSFAGTPLSVSQDGKRRSFKRGLAMKSHSRITYRLAKKYQRFQATAGFNPDAAKEGHLELQLLADNKEVFSQSISHSDPPIAIDIPVADANRLTIIVDYGENLDIGDQLHLGDARFTK